MFAQAIEPSSCLVSLFIPSLHFLLASVLQIFGPGVKFPPSESPPAWGDFQRRRRPTACLQPELTGFTADVLKMECCCTLIWEDRFRAAVVWGLINFQRGFCLELMTSAEVSASSFPSCVTKWPNYPLPNIIIGHTWGVRRPSLSW